MSQLRARFSPSRLRARLLASAAALAMVLPAVVSSAGALVFGPQIYTRAPGRPVAVKKKFTVKKPTGKYTLRVVNHGVTSAVIEVNGQRIFDRDDFTVRDRNRNNRRHDDRDDPDHKDRDRDDCDRDEWTPVPVLEHRVNLRDGVNEIVVELRSRRGTWLTAEIAGDSAPTPTDTTPPTITASAVPPPNANGWNTTDVTVTFTCADSGSGIATCPSAVTVSAETAGQPVSGTATDKSGNTATASVTVKIDKTAPVVTASPSPAANANNWNNGPVAVTFAATDALSGVAPGSLSAPINLAANGTNLSASGQATDLAGNAGSVTRAGINIDQTRPTIFATLSPGAGDWLGTPVTAHFECLDAESGVATCPPDQVIAGEGANQTVTGTAVDNAGNSAAVTSAPFGIDVAPPAVAVTLSPAPNANGWNNTPVTAHFTCADGGSGIANCPPDQLIDADTANQVVEGEATDQAGNTSVASAVVNIDMTPPTVSFTSPVSGSTVFSALVIATGTASDDLSGVAGATCNAATVLINGRGLECSATLTPGANSVTATASDLAGNTGTATLALTYTRAPAITITSPATLSYVNISPTTVSGTVDDPTAVVTINSVPAAVVNGSFSLALPVAEGPNIITATATTSSGGIGTASVEVTLDTTPPHVTVTSPPDRFVTTEASISVAGNVNDIVVGTVNDQQAQVTVNGIAAPVSNRTFLAANVPLAIGPNAIEVVGRDRVGNAVTTEITVVRQALTHARIQLVSGNNQTAPIGSLLPAPIVVALLDAAGNPAPNTKVIFKVTQNNGQVAADAASAATAIATTDAQGRAQVRWTVGARAGAGGNAVDAYAVGFEGTALFVATGTQGTAGQIVVDTGNGQVGAVGQDLPKPFIAVVVDTGNNRLGGVPVTFTVASGDGSLDGAPSTTVTTDPDGRAAATLRLGPVEGNSNNVVRASFESNPGSPATFIASGRIPGDPAKTMLTGVVLDNSNVPIPGVIVRAVLTNELHSNAAVVQTAIAAQTDAQGQFSIERAPVGLVKVLVDGSTAARPGSYPSLEYDLVTVAGQNNTVGTPIYLLPLNTANKLCVTETTGGGTLTMADAPGFSLAFAPGQVTFPGGSKSGCIGVTVVHGDKVPMEPAFGQQPRFIVTIQPPGAHFNPPAPMTLPNVDGLQPREITEMYSFDHDIGSFVAIGTGTVSADGLAVRSNPGIGVLKAGWHGGGNQNPTGNAESPPTASISISPKTVHVAVDKTVSFTAVGSPAKGGSYAWGLGPTAAGDDESAAALVTSPSCAGQGSCAATVKGVHPGNLTLRVHFMSAEDGEKPDDARIIVDAKPKLKSLTFGGDHFHAVANDNVNAAPYVAPQWLDQNGNGSTTDSGDHKFPVAYKRKSTVTVSGVFTLSGPVANASAKVTGTGGGLHFEKTVTGINGDSFVVSDATSRETLPDFITKKNPLQIVWKVSFDTENNYPASSFVSAGTSANIVYVTLGDSIAIPLYETSLDIGRRQTDGRAVSPDAHQAEVELGNLIWRTFQSRNVPRVDGVVMRYWNPPDPRCQTLAIMLATFPSQEQVQPGNGTCAAWSQLLVSTLGAQGIASEIYELKPNTVINPGAKWMLVKEWKFGSHLRTGLDGINSSPIVGDDVPVIPIGKGKPSTPCVGPGPNGALNSTRGGDDGLAGAQVTSGANGICESTATGDDVQLLPVGKGSPDQVAVTCGPNGVLDSARQGDDTSPDGQFAGNRYPYLFDSPDRQQDAWDQIGVPAQFNPNPISVFGNHFIVKWNDKFFDPSYGNGPFTTTLEHENFSIAGIATDDRARAKSQQPELQYCPDLCPRP